MQHDGAGDTRAATNALVLDEVAVPAGGAVLIACAMNEHCINHSMMNKDQKRNKIVEKIIMRANICATFSAPDFRGVGGSPPPAGRSRPVVTGIEARSNWKSLSSGTPQARDLPR